MTCNEKKDNKNKNMKFYENMDINAIMGIKEN